jgi:hypothetical protein
LPLNGVTIIPRSSMQGSPPVKGFSGVGSSNAVVYNSPRIPPRFLGSAAAGCSMRVIATAATRSEGTSRRISFLSKDGIDVRGRPIVLIVVAEVVRCRVGHTAYREPACHRYHRDLQWIYLLSPCRCAPVGTLVNDPGRELMLGAATRTDCGRGGRAPIGRCGCLYTRRQDRIS